MAGTGKLGTVKELARTAKHPDIRDNPAIKRAQSASRRSSLQPKAVRLKNPVHITEDEADILISMRREKEKRISLAEVLRKQGYGLEG
jgi:hypothetical protein